MNPSTTISSSVPKLLLKTKFALLAKTFSVVAMVLALTCATDAATVTFSLDAPTPGSIVISNLVGAYLTGTVNDAPNSNVSDPKYIADDQPVQGQTFTTGTNALGYKLTSVTLRHVSYKTSLLVPGINYTIRITRPLT